MPTILVGGKFPPVFCGWGGWMYSACTDRYKINANYAARTTFGRSVNMCTKRTLRILLAVALLLTGHINN